MNEESSKVLTFLLAFVAITISLAQFASEMKSFQVDMGYLEVSIYELYLLFTIFSIFAIYLFMLYTIGEIYTKNLFILSVLGKIEQLARWIISTILTFPIIVAIVAVVNRFTFSIGQYTANTLVVWILFPLGIIVSYFLGEEYRKKKLEQLISKTNYYIEKANDLIAAQEHTEAFLNGYIAVEVGLKEEIKRKTGAELKFVPSGELIKLGTQVGALLIEDVELIKKIRDKRNKTLHEGLFIDENDALEVIRFAEKIAKRANHSL